MPLVFLFLALPPAQCDIYIYILIVFSGEVNTLLYFILPSSYKAAQCTVCVSDQDHRNCLEPAKKKKNVTALLAYILMPCTVHILFQENHSGAKLRVLIPCLRCRNLWTSRTVCTGTYRRYPASSYLSLKLWCTYPVYSYLLLILYIGVYMQATATYPSHIGAHCQPAAIHPLIHGCTYSAYSYLPPLK